MRNFGKIILIFIITMMFSANSAFSLDVDLDLDDLQQTANKFVDSMAISLPFNSTMGLNWSDAYIGQLFAVPPHLGVGITAGFTTMEFGAVNKMLERFNVSLPAGFNWGGFPLPGYTAELRIGGIVLPFDLGVKFGVLDLKEDFWDTIKLGDIDFSMNYLLIGGDLRYALLGKKKKSIIKIAIGVGFNYMRGGLSLPVPDISLDFGSANPLEISDSYLNLLWETKSLDFKAQASFSLAFITPYVGLGVSHAWSSAGYGLFAKEDIQVNNNDITTTIINELQTQGLTSITSKGLVYRSDVNGWSFRAYAGFSINVPFVRFDLTAMYDFLSQNYGATFGTRFQL